VSKVLKVAQPDKAIVQTKATTIDFNILANNRKTWGKVNAGEHSPTTVVFLTIVKDILFVLGVVIFGR
jgi:hypothetical protein